MTLGNHRGEMPIRLRMAAQIYANHHPTGEISISRALKDADVLIAEHLMTCGESGAWEADQGSTAVPSNPILPFGPSFQFPDHRDETIRALSKQIADQTTELDRLRAENATLAADSKRLDAMIDLCLKEIEEAAKP